MDFTKNIDIPFRGLKEGDHILNFKINKKFFDQFSYSEVKEGELDVAITLNIKPKFLVLKILLKGTINVLCDRCLDHFDHLISFSGSLYVKFGEEFLQEDSEMMIIPASEDKINLNHYIYECICLSIPYKKIHPEDEFGTSKCDKEMLKKLNKHKTEEENEKTDPRWDQLKKMRNN